MVTDAGALLREAKATPVGAGMKPLAEETTRARSTANIERAILSRVAAVAWPAISRSGGACRRSEFSAITRTGGKSKK